MHHGHLTTSLFGMLGGMLFAFESLGAPALQVASPWEIAFPAPARMQPQVDFWTRVYVEIGTSEGFVHDDRVLSVAYETLAVVAHRRQRGRQIAARIKYWRGLLEGLAGGAPAAGADAQRAVRLWQEALGRRPTAQDFKVASARLRFQLGQRDTFKAGLIRSGRYEAQLRKIFAEHGLPEDLAYLPHVESSFNTHAYSKAGAAGMWQFIRSTGQRYLRIDDVVDERLAPIKATIAACKLLRANYRRLGTWPLALTAYNHGAGGMQRASAALGSTDIMAIIERYDGRSFGFASRNFYAQFLAARGVARAYRRHFGALELERPVALPIVRLPFYANSRDILRHLSISEKVLASLNPSLRGAVFRAEKYIPRNFELRLPAGLSATSADGLLAAIPAHRRYDSQPGAHVHLVRRGETLSHIAKRYSTSVSRLVAMNRLDNGHRIYVGQELELHAAHRSARPGRRTESNAQKTRAVRSEAPVEVSLRPRAESSPARTRAPSMMKAAYLIKLSPAMGDPPGAGHRPP